MRWSQERITEWADKTFGQVNARRIAVRMNIEMAELISALEHGELEEARMECADLNVMLRQIAERLGVDLNEITDQKMDINESRTWAKGKDGSFRHVE